MADEEDDSAGMPAPIILKAAGKSVRLGGPAKWLRAIENNDLTPDTVVDIQTSDGGFVARRAGDVDWLRPLFQSAGLAGLPSQEGASSDDVASTSSRKQDIPNPVAVSSPGGGESSPVEPAPLAPELNRADAEEVLDSGLRSSDQAHAERSSASPEPVEQKKSGLSTGQVWGLFALVCVGLVLLVQTCGPGPEKAATARQDAIVAVYARREVTIRSGPGAANEKLGQALRGEYLVGRWVLGVDGETQWLQITDGPHKDGFAWGKNLRTEAPPSFLAKTPTTRIWKAGGLIYPEPNGVGQPLESLPQRSTVLVLATGSDGWVEIGLKAGGVGYIRDSEQLATETRTSPATVRKALVKSAKKNVAKAPVETPVPLQPLPPPPPAQSASPRRAPIQWARKPSGDDLARYYPSAALRAQISGRVVLSCEITGRGEVTSCSVASESPAGYGFGDAALRLAPKFRMKGDPSEGIVPGIVRIPINFSVPE